MQSLIITLLIIAVLALIWHVRELWGEADLLKTMERKTQESQANYRKEFNDFLLAYRQERKVILERVKAAEETIDGFRTAYDMFGQNYEEDRKALGECVNKLQDELKEAKDSLDEIKDSTLERNSQEARMFEGITNMMNYDPSQAIKAVKGDA